MDRRSLALGTAALALLLLTGPADAGSPRSTASSERRFERFFVQGPSAQYGSDFGGLTALPLGPVTMPAGPRADVVVTVTFGHHVTPGDTGTIGLLFDEDGEPPFRRSFRPAEYRVADAEGASDSMTLQFMKRFVPANGRTYQLVLHANLDRAGCCGHIRTFDVVAVIDVRAAGAH